MDKRKQAWVENAPTETLQRIVNSAGAQFQTSTELPLAGYVQVSGIGRVKISAMQAELQTRMPGR